jgi:hypothetical protein
MNTAVDSVNGLDCNGARDLVFSAAMPSRLQGGLFEACACLSDTQLVVFARLSDPQAMQTSQTARPEATVMSAALAI